MIKVEALEDVTLESGITIRKGKMTWLSNGKAEDLAEDGKVRVLMIPENRRFK
jgi:hypothetical protein